MPVAGLFLRLFTLRQPRRQVAVSTTRHRPHMDIIETTVSRRRLLQAGLATGAGFFAFGRDFWTRAIAAPAVQGPSPYGPLLPPDANGIQLPAGFTSRRIAQFGAPVPLADGSVSDYAWHRGPDGGAVFMQDDGGWIYVSNSEQPVVDGGVGAVRFDADGNVVSAYPVLTGTNNNCAGGPTPWGTWLSCEENFIGFVWECDPTGERAPVKLPGLGQFNHEAAAVDPVRRHIYLTEDQGDGAFYRFTPLAWPDLTVGVLEVAIVDPGAIRTPYAAEIRSAFAEFGGDWDDFDPSGVLLDVDETEPGPVTWMPVLNPLGLPVECRYQVPNAAIFKGGEGCWYDDGMVWFTCKGSNRVWQYDTERETVDILYDVADHGDDPVLRGVDNITVHAQSGDLLVAEDGGNMELVIVSAEDRTVAPFLRYPVSDSEITGPAFTADGTRLYWSSQAKNVLPLGGETFEITGPFRGTAAAPIEVVTPAPAPPAPLDPPPPPSTRTPPAGELPATGSGLAAAGIALLGGATALRRRSEQALDAEHVATAGLEQAGHEGTRREPEGEEAAPRHPDVRMGLPPQARDAATDDRDEGEQ